MAVIPTVINIDEQETNTLIELESRAPGTYAAKMMIRGNSLLSSVFVKSISPGATLQVNYWDTTTGTENTPERYDLNSHDLIDDTAAGKTFRITVPKIHNKPQIECIVTGGTVEFGVYITVVSSFVTDMDNALIRDGDDFVQTDSRALPVACYNEATGKLHFIRCVDGGLPVSEYGDPFNVFDRVATVPGAFVNILSFAVPAGIVRKIRQAGVTCSISGEWELLIDGNLVRDGQTAPGHTDSDKKFDPAKPVGSGLVVTLRFKARLGGPITTVSGYLDALDIDL